MLRHGPRGQRSFAGMRTFRSLSVSDWHQHEIRDGLSRATMRDKLRTLQRLPLAAPAQQQALRETVLALLTELDVMDETELEFFRRSRLSLMW